MTQAALRPLGTLSLGEIAAAVPGATAVFRRHKLDYCCGGSQSLDQAARQKNLDLGAVEAELTALAPQPSSLPQDVDGLIDYILERYHTVHRRELSELYKLATRVEHVHAENPATPKGLSLLLKRMQNEMESHMQKEEQILFPMMRMGGSPMIVHPIGVMRHEHDNHGEELKALSELTDDMTPPPGACNTRQALYAGLAKFRDDLMEHIHIENNILFPRYEA